MKKIFISFTLVASFCSLHASSLYEKIEAINLQTFTPTVRAEKTYTSHTEHLESALHEQQNISPHHKRQLAFSIFKTYESRHPIDESQVIDETTWRDLNLFAGSVAKPECYVGAVINRTSTELGAVRLLGMLANPEIDSTRLEHQKEIVTELVENEELFAQLDSALQQLQNHENFLLSWWDSHDVFKSKMVLHKLIKLPGLSSVAELLNVNSPVLESRERLYQANVLFMLMQQAVATVLFPLAGLLYAYKPALAVSLKNWARNSYLKLFPQLNQFYLYGFLIFLASTVFHNNFLTATNDFIAGEHNWLSLWATYDQFTSNNFLLRGLQSKLISLARCVEIVSILSSVTESNPILHQQFKRMFHIGEGPLRDLMDNLQSSTFAGDEASSFSFAGRIVATAKMAWDHRDDLVELFIQIGEIDAYMSLARLYKESRDQKNHWGFPQFASFCEPQADQFCPLQPRVYNISVPVTCCAHSQPQPALQLINFWNPLINRAHAISNSIEFGNNHPRTIIITGINKGGKSTSMKGVTLAALCAQTIGLVPAEQCKLTPFSKILTYSNQHDDIAKGVSHFEAGEQRALYIYNTTKNLHDFEHALCMLDEAFDGTNHAVSIAATTTLVKNLGLNPHVICMATTHLPEIAKLADDQSAYFSNYHVESLLNANGTITYTYKLKPGVSYQNQLALELLRQQHYPAEFIAAAYAEMNGLSSVTR